MVANRTVSLPGIWADDAQTTIPTPPIANTTYRNTEWGETEANQGWAFQKIVDSADFNQAMWYIFTLQQMQEQFGILPWCSTTAYKQNGICLGSDGIFYWAKSDNTGVNPINDTGMTTWGIFLDPGDNFVTETVLMNQINLCEKLANKVQALSSSSTTTQYPSAKCVYDNITNAKADLQAQITSNDTDITNLKNNKQNNITGGATSITTSNLTTNRALISDGNGKVAVSAVTNTELGYLDGVTSSVQNQINSKQATITGGATTITGSNLTANRALISNGSGKVAVSNITNTELNYLDGVTANIQNQLNSKGGLTSTNTWSGTNKFKVNDTNHYLQFIVNDETYNMRGTGIPATGLALLEGNNTDKPYFICDRNGNINLGCSTKKATASYSLSASDNSSAFAYTSWVNSRITSIMNSKNLVSFPDLSAGTTQTLPYTAPNDGFIFLRSGSGGGSFLFNNETVIQSGNYYDQVCAFLPVKKGWVISQASGGLNACVFYPSLNV